MLNDTYGTLSGFAWSENLGWVSFRPSRGGVRIDPSTSAFDCYAWSENAG